MNTYNKLIHMKSKELISKLIPFLVQQETLKQTNQSHNPHIHTGESNDINTSIMLSNTRHGVSDTTGDRFIH